MKTATTIVIKRHTDLLKALLPISVADSLPDPRLPKSTYFYPVCAEKFYEY
jgi:hypothetical protein